MNTKIFAKGTAQQTAGRAKIRDLINARTADVIQAGGNVTGDETIINLIGDIVAKSLLSLYCTEKGIARTGTKPELVRRLLDAGWTLKPDIELQNDYTKLQGIHTLTVEEDKEEAGIPGQQAGTTETKVEPGKDGPASKETNSAPDIIETKSKGPKPKEIKTREVKNKTGQKRKAVSRQADDSDSPERLTGDTPYGTQDHGTNHKSNSGLTKTEPRMGEHHLLHRHHRTLP